MDMKISKRRVEQVWKYYSETGKEPIIGKNLGRLALMKVLQLRPPRQPLFILNASRRHACASAWAAGEESLGSRVRR